MEKSVVLIDAENVLRPWWTLSEQKGVKGKIDYAKLVNVLSKGTNLLRAYFYDATSENIPLKKKKFLEALQKQGIQLRTKVLKNRNFECSVCKAKTTKQVQKGVDVSLATDILRHAFQETCEVCIIVSGDEDYKDAMEVAKDRGIKIWVASFRTALSYEVERTADKVVILDDLCDEIIM